MAKTVASELAKLLEAPALDKQSLEFDAPQLCAVTGETITAGYRIKDATTSATNEFMDLFHGTPDGYISEDVARLMKVQRIGNVAIHNDILHRPMISNESAKDQGRACWSELVGDEESGVLLTQTLKHKMDVAGLGKYTKGVKVSFDTNYEKARTKLVNIKGISSKASMCPVIMEGHSTAIQFAWDVGIGNCTGCGFGALR